MNVAPVVQLVQANPSPTAVVRATTTWREFSSLWKTLLDEVYAAAAAGAIQQEGHNVMVYLDDVPHVEVGIQVVGSFDPVGRVVPSALPAGPAAMTVHRGPYNRLDDAHSAVRQWCAAEHLHLTGVRWEVYGDWAEDPAQLETEVWYQVVGTPDTIAELRSLASSVPRTRSLVDELLAERRLAAASE